MNSRAAKAAATLFRRARQAIQGHCKDSSLEDRKMILIGLPRSAHAAPAIQAP
jgi:hypothetical protein